jgi:hypothetical protein
MHAREDVWTRRRFLAVLGGTAVALPNIITSKALGAGVAPAASDRITVGAIGIGNMGKVNLHAFFNDRRAQVLAVCDVRRSHALGAKKRVDGHHGNHDCAVYEDYRELIARPDLDVIMCATPDHTHAQISIDAMKAGKDVYCEKPLTLTITEGRKMVDTARRHGRVLSCGSQRVIGDYGRTTCAARSGRFGRILVGQANPGASPFRCLLGDGGRVPDGFNFDLWLGPAPLVPYHTNRVGESYNMDRTGFRSWSDYSGGMTTDWGGHVFGGLLHGMGLDHTGPTSIVPADAASRQPMIVKFINGMEIHVAGGRNVTYRCEGGVARAERNEPVPPGLRWYEGGASHTIPDFLNCVKTRMRPFQDVEYAHRTATLCHLVNICRQLNRPLQWDPDKEDFINDPVASRLVDRPRRGPWQI